MSVDSTPADVLGGTAKWCVVHGDALDVLPTLPDQCIDSIVIDPPYFLVNDSGSGFMGRTWDSLSIAHVIAGLFFRFSSLDLSMVEVDAAAGPVSIPNPRNSIEPAESAVSASSAPQPKIDTLGTGSSVAGHVITKHEALVLCSVLSPSLTTYLRELPTHARFVLPSSLTSLEENTALQIALLLRKAPVWLATTTRHSNMDSHPLTNGATGDLSGITHASSSTSETTGPAADAVSTVAEKIGTSNATTSDRGAFHEIIARVTSLPSVSRAIRLCTKDPATIGIISTWWHSRWAREAFRVLKPGGHLLTFGGTRTIHQITGAVEEVGFKIRDQIAWAYGSGFPKSLNVAKAIDAHLGIEPTIVGYRTLTGNAALSTEEKGGTYQSGQVSSSGAKKEISVTTPTSSEAKLWDGWGTALKPAVEPCLLARKPLSGSVAETVLAHGTGGLNIDACRVGTDWNEPDRPESWKRSGHGADPDAEKIASPPGIGIDLHPDGRWPANLVLSHTDECERIGTRLVTGDPRSGEGARPAFFGDVYAENGSSLPVGRGYGDAEGNEKIGDWHCVPGCPVRELDRQSGVLPPGGSIVGDAAGSARTNPVTYGQHAAPRGEWEPYDDTGGASRFFTKIERDELDDITPFIYAAKASRAERETGLDHLPARSGAKAVLRKEGSAGVDSPRAGAGRTAKSIRNTHPTIKPIALMQYLCRLVTPPGGITLDMFTGSGSTGVAAYREGFRFIGIELNDTTEEPFVTIAKARIAHAARIGRQTSLLDYAKKL